MAMVYGIPLSPFVRKVLLSLDYKGVAYDITPVVPVNKPEGFEKISPLGKIPAFEDDLLTISDSSVICEYLEERYVDKPLRPKGIVERARCRWLEEYADTKLVEVTGPPIFFERVAKPGFLDQPCDEARVQEALTELVPPVFDYLEGQVKGAAFIHGDSIALSDFSITSVLINLQLSGEGVDAERWPKLAAYYDFMIEEPLVKARLASDQAMLSS